MPKASTNHIDDRKFALISLRSLTERAWTICTGVPHLQLVDEFSAVYTWHLSLLISIELLNIPPPTTLVPFRQPRFTTLPVHITVLTAALTVQGIGQTF